MKTAFAGAAAVALLAACAETPGSEAAAERSAVAAPSAADTSARSPMTVNPTPKGQPLPDSPPTLPPDDKSMPPGPVNPPR